MFFSKDNIFDGILKGPVDFFRSKADIHLKTSSGLVGERKIELPTGFSKNEEKCLFELGI